jgi:hypothetical protein
MSTGAKIIEGLEEAIAGDFARVTIEGQTWARVKDIHADQQEIMRINNSLRETLLAIKDICAGDRAPNWVEDGYRVTVTRGQIMDLVDAAVR